VLPGVGHFFHGALANCEMPSSMRFGAAKSPSRSVALIKSIHEFLEVLSAAMRTFLLAGFALNIIFSPLKGLTPHAPSWLVS